MRRLVVVLAILLAGMTTIAAPVAGQAGCTTTRLAGDGRIDTAVAISRDARDRADTVLLARADAYPDALAAVPLAAALDAPLLLTTRDALPAATRAEIDRLGATTAILLGGPAAIGPAVVDALDDDDVVVDRIAGDDRFATARLVAERLPTRTGRAVVVEGRNPDPNRGWPDAVVAGPLAAGRGDPVLMVEANRLPGATEEALLALGVERITVVGGPVAVSPAVLAALEDPDGDGTPDRVVERVSGPARAVTATEVAWEQVRTSGAPSSLWFATSRAFPDALAAGAAAAAAEGVLLLVDGRGGFADEPARDLRRDLDVALDRVVVAGGEAAVGARAFDDIAGQVCSGAIPPRVLGGDGVTCRPGGLANHARFTPGAALADAWEALQASGARDDALDVLRAAGPLPRHMVTDDALRDDVESWLDRVGNRGISVALHEAEHAWQFGGAGFVDGRLRSCLALSGEAQGLLGSSLADSAPPPSVVGDALRARAYAQFEDGSFERDAMDRFLDTYLACTEEPCASSNERVSSLLGEAHAYVHGYELRWALARSGAIEDPTGPQKGGRSIALDGGYAVLPGLAMYLGELRREHPAAHAEMVALNGDAVAELWRILERAYPGPFADDDGRWWDLFFGDGNAREVQLATNHRAGVDTPPRPVRSADGRRGFDPDPGSEQRVRFVYFVEADETYEPRLEAAIGQQALALQAFWFDTFGGTFRLADPVVTVVQGDHDAAWYHETPDGYHDDPRWYRLGNIAFEVRGKLADDAARLVTYPSSSSDEPRVGVNFGGAWMDGEDLRCITGEAETFPYPDGNAAHCLGHVAHELGHVWGLGHTGPDEDCMQFGFYDETTLCAFGPDNVAQVVDDPSNEGWLDVTLVD